MREILTRDTTATYDVDIVIERIKSELEFAKNKLKEMTDDDPEKQACIDLIALYEKEIEDTMQVEDRPFISIGYVPATVMSNLDLKHLAVSKSVERKEKYDYETMVGFSDVCRELCKWGVKGHKNFVPFESEKQKHRNKEYNVASEEMVEIYELNNWVTVLREKIVLFNKLSEDKKKELLPMYGVKQETAIVANVQPKK